MIQQPSATFEATYEAGITGLVGSIEVAIHDQQGNVVVGPQSTGIAEIEIIAGTPSGGYSAVLVAPATEGQYAIVWSNDGTFADNTGAFEDLTVQTAILGLSPLPPLDADESGMGPPCVAWTSRESVAACCDGFADASTEEQDAAIRAATEILFEISDRLYSGECGPVTVRPCNQACSCWGPWNAGLSYSWDPTRSRWACDGKVCGCSPLSEVVLAGLPIREISEVLIDGVALDADEYALMEPNILVRMRDVTEPNRRATWPGCQTLDLPETEEGTFAVSYTYGADPPQAGRSAAAALACEIWRACNAEECALPEGVTRVDRAGITMELPVIAAAALKNGTTGVTAIDAFIAPFAASSGDMRSSVWSPDLAYPRRYRPATGT